MNIAAVYYDGRNSARHPVAIEIAAGELIVRGEGFEASWPLAAVRVSPRLGNTARRLAFPDGSQCETSDNDGVDWLLEQVAPGSRFSLHRLERSLPWAMAALALAVAVAWGVIGCGIPALAKQVALNMPAATETGIGDESLRGLDRALLRPSTLPTERQAALRTLLAGLAADTGPGLAVRLEFRAGGRLGANALALPAGILVLTDELLALAADDEEITAVLAHELGHVRHRHLMRLLLQNSAAVVAVAMMVGDLSSLTSLAAAAPALLLQFAYSRQFEFEADDFAVALLARRGIGGAKFADILERLEMRRGATRSAPLYLSTHPDTGDRAARARQAR